MDSSAQGKPCKNAHCRRTSKRCAVVAKACVGKENVSCSSRAASTKTSSSRALSVRSDTNSTKTVDSRQTSVCEKPPKPKTASSALLENAQLKRRIASLERQIASVDRQIAQSERVASDVAKANETNSKAKVKQLTSKLKTERLAHGKRLAEANAKLAEANAKLEKADFKLAVEKNTILGQLVQAKLALRENMTASRKAEKALNTKVAQLEGDLLEARRALEMYRGEKWECPVCLEPRSESKRMAAVPCGHVFCRPCIVQVARSSEMPACCPLCQEHFCESAVTLLFLDTIV